MRPVRKRWQRRRWREAVSSVELDEAGRREGPHPLQAVAVPLIQHDIFSSTGPTGWTRRPPELSWPMRGGGTSGKAAETIIASNGARSGAPSVPSATITTTFANASRGEVALRLPGDIRPDFDADNLGGEAGQQRGLVTVTGADLEYALFAGQADSRDHRGRQRRLGGDLIVRDRYWLVRVCRVDVCGGHERLPRSAPDRIQHTAIGHTRGPGGQHEVFRAGSVAIACHARASHEPSAVLAAGRDPCLVAPPTRVPWHLRSWRATGSPSRRHLAAIRLSARPNPPRSNHLKTRHGVPLDSTTVAWPHKGL